MTKTPDTPEQIDDTDLDVAAGAGANHKTWSDLQSFSQAVHRPGSDVAMEELTLTHEYITRKS
ncbi:MAG: hypothetical protein AAFN27_05885 [Pseudomonadota bacterium]